jgi:hypothetical protein
MDKLIDKIQIHWLRICIPDCGHGGWEAFLTKLPLDFCGNVYNYML